MVDERIINEINEKFETEMRELGDTYNYDYLVYVIP